MVEGMGFVSDIALAFIAFGVGRYFKREAFQETGLGIFVIVLLESLLAGILVTLSMHYIFHLDWDFSLLLEAIIRYGTGRTWLLSVNTGRGEFVNILLQVVAFDDAVCLIVFSLSTAVINARGG